MAKSRRLGIRQPRLHVEDIDEAEGHRYPDEDAESRCRFPV